MEDSLATFRNLRHEAIASLGERNWRSLWRYGKVVGGPHSGQYVSSLRFDVIARLVKRLVSGYAIPVCLMNRPDQVLAEVFSLRLINGRLTQSCTARLRGKV